MSRHILTKLFAFIVVILSVWCVYAVPLVQNVTAKQRFPWNGLVDITCTVTGIDGTTNGFEFSLATVIPDSGDVRKVLHYWVLQGGVRYGDCSAHTNGNYRLLWDAQADLGQVIYSNLVVRVTLLGKRDKVQLWEGGPYWAVMNIGAEMPWESGYYFWWGDTVGYKREGEAWVASDGSSMNFSFDSSNTPSYGNIDAQQSEGWMTADRVLVPWHDAAQVQWGCWWRMPTSQELDDLNNNCDWTYTTTNGVFGYVVRGRGNYASTSIFLPCAGYGSGTSLASGLRSGGFYWASTSIGDAYSHYLYFDSGCIDTHGYSFKSYRYFGCCVRPVQGFTK